MKRIAIVAGEMSGDILGGGLIRELRQLYPDCVFEGIGGANMIAEGFISLFPLERLAVMGLVEPLKRLPELLSIRKQLKKRYTETPPDIFIGIDAPDFNFNLETHLKCAGVLTAHYVSPSVWAWRSGRVKTVAKAADLLLALFPFEGKYYQDYDLRVAFVGHPLADKIDVLPQQEKAREQLKLSPDRRYVALLPGSRKSEVEKLCRTFLEAAERCAKNIDNLTFLLPAANEGRLAEIREHLSSFPELDVKLVLRQSHEVMAAAETVLMASGTTTLEAMLLKRPMVIAYRMAPFSYWLLSRLVTSKYIGLPNILAGKPLVPEFIQDQASPGNISEALLNYLESGNKNAAMIDEFTDIHRSLRKNASYSAAQAIQQIWIEKSQ